MTKKIIIYNAAFKDESVKKISNNNGNVSAIVKQLGIPYSTGNIKLIKEKLSALSSISSG